MNGLPGKDKRINFGLLVPILYKFWIAITPTETGTQCAWFSTLTEKKKLTIIFKGHFGGWCPNLPIFWVKEKFLKHEYTWLLSNDNSLILSRKSGKCTEKIFRKISRFWPGFGQSDI